MINSIQNFMIRNIKNIPYFFNRKYTFQTQQNNYALIGKLSASIIHDILTPINTLSLATELQDTHIEKLNPLIKNSTSQIKEFIEIMKDFLNQTDIESVTHINHEILKCIKLLSSKATSQNIQIQFIEFDQIYTKISPLNIYQIIINLLSNAIEASSTSKIRKVIVILRKNKGSFQIDCKDFGQGIEANMLHKIQNPYFTTKEDGQGLGLYSVTQILKFLNGKLEINSEPQNGSLFSCIIPLLK